MKYIVSMVPLLLGGYITYEGVADHLTAPGIGPRVVVITLGVILVVMGLLFLLGPAGRKGRRVT